jgi:hypothetical protein
MHAVSLNMTGNAGIQSLNLNAKAQRTQRRARKEIQNRRKAGFQLFLSIWHLGFLCAFALGCRYQVLAAA